MTKNHSEPRGGGQSGSPNADLLSVMSGVQMGQMVMLIGANDSGKSTLARSLATSFGATGRTPALIDLDVGQGTIGPPCAVHLALMKMKRAPEHGSPAASPSGALEWSPAASHFVGGITPVGRLLDLCIGASRLALAAREYQPDVVLVDTCGLVSGAVGRALKQRLIEVLAPDIVVALHRDTELEPILESVRGLAHPHVVRLKVGGEVGRKSPSARAARRSARFLAALEEAKPHLYAFEELGMVGRSFGLGPDLGLAARTLLARSLGAPVLSASLLADGLAFVVIDGDRWSEIADRETQSALRCKRIQVVPYSHYRYLVVGMIDRGGALRGLGLIEAIDFERRQITVLSRCPASVVAQVRFGNYRVRPDGREIGDIRVGDV